MRSGGRLSWLLAVGLAMAGCASPPELDVERQWGDSMRRLAMFGFYPMSEDVQVGDLFLHAPPRDGTRRSVARFSLLRVASLPRERNRERDVRSGVLDHLRWQQTEDRLRIQALPERGGTQGAPRAVTRGTAPQEGRYDVGHADEAAADVRLQRSAIPALTVGRVSEAQLGAAGIFGNFGARTGLGWSSATALTIALQDIQEMTLDSWRLSRMLRVNEAHLNDRARAEHLLFHLGQLRPDLLEYACRADEERLNREQVELLVMGRVLYAGGIEYSFSRNAETAVRLAVDLQSTLPGQRQAPQVPGTFPAFQPGAASRPTPAATEPAAAAGQRLATLLSAVTGETGGGSRAGATTSFGVGSFGTLALKTTFNRPIAVGAGSRVRTSFLAALRGDFSVEDMQDSTALEQRRNAARRFCTAQFPGLDLTRLDAVFTPRSAGVGPARPLNLQRTAP